MKMWTPLPRDHDAKWLVLVVVVVLGLGVGQLWLWGSVFDAASTFRDRQTQQQQLDNVRRLVEGIRAADSSEQTLTEQAAVAFPLPETVPHIVERVEALAESRGLVLELQSIAEQPRSGTKHVLQPFDLNVVLLGPPQALLAFLDSVEHMQEFTQVEQWAMEAAPADAAGGKVYALTMKLRFFLQQTFVDG